MADIEVEKVREDEEGFAFRVRVSEAGGQSGYDVTLSRRDFERLGTGAGSPEAFVRSCFRFLLDRERKESILSRFDIRQIAHYFPEFEQEIQRPRESP